MFLSLPLWFTRSFAVTFLKGVCSPERDNEDVDAMYSWSSSGAGFSFAISVIGIRSGILSSVNMVRSG